MNCELVRKNLALYLYQELPPAQEEELEAHLDICGPCRDALYEERTLHNLVSEAAAEPPVELLASCRRELETRLAQQPRRSWWQAIGGFFGGLRLNPVAAMALVALGFIGARLWDTQTALAPELRVRAVEPAPDGRVRMVVDEVRRKTMTGRLDDETVRGLLVRAANGAGDPELRARTMEMLAARTDSDEVRRAMLAAIQRDPAAEVRLKAIEGLRPFATQPEAARALAHALLADENPGVRTKAIDVMLDNFRSDSIGTLQEVVLREQNPYIRQRSMEALRQVRASIEPF
jgi:hypothetical protein